MSAIPPGRLLWRAVRLRCPVCGSGHLFRWWVRQVPACPRCGLEFERTEGHWIGYVGLNTIFTFVLFVVLVVGTFAQYPDVRAAPVVLACLFTALVVPVAFLPFSRTIWTAIDLMMRPLEVGEVAPGWAIEQERQG